MAPPSRGYTDAVGPFEAKVSISPVEPPHRKGRRPQYAWNKLVKQIWWVGETRGLKTTGRRELRCGVAKSVIPRQKSNDRWLWPGQRLCWRRKVQQASTLAKSLSGDSSSLLMMYSCSPMDMHARLRNCLGRAHVSCTSRHYSRRSCCQDRWRSILQRRMTRRNTTQLEKSASGPLQVHLGLDLELWYPSGLPASNCNPSVFQQARNGWPSFIGAYKVLLALLDTVFVGRLYYERIN